MLSLRGVSVDLLQLPPRLEVGSMLYICSCCTRNGTYKPHFSSKTGPLCWTSCGLCFAGVTDMRLPTTRHGRIQVRTRPMTSMTRGHQAFCGYTTSLACAISAMTTSYCPNGDMCNTLAGWWTRACGRAATICTWPRAHLAAPCGCSCTSTMASQPHGSNFIDNNEILGSFSHVNSLLCCFATCWVPCF